MDVVKIATLAIALLLASSCSQKKTAESVTASSTGCYENKLEKRFIVQWEDGTFTVEHGKSMDDFRETFVTENLEMIKHVDTDHVIKMNTSSDISEMGTIKPSLNWGPQKIEAHTLWDQNIQGEGVTVAVIDGMVDVTHAQLSPNIYTNGDEIPNNGIDDDRNGFVDDVHGIQVNKGTNDPLTNTHGSHVAGIIAADPTQGPIFGVAPKAKILPAQFINNSGSGSLGDAIIAMNYAASRGAKIMNLSWGGAPCVPDNLLSAMEKLSNEGILLVTAAGNGDRWGNGIDMDTNPDYPSAFNLLNQINVAASTINDYMISFSNFGINKVQVAAPGVDIYSTIPGNSIKTMDGTSMAAPMTAGVAALLWSAYPQATTQQIKQALLKGVDVNPAALFEVSTRGRINAAKSLAALQKSLGL